MPRRLDLSLFPQQAFDIHFIHIFAAKRLRCHPNDIQHINQLRRSIDARQNKVKIRLQIEVYTHGETVTNNPPAIEYPNVSQAPKIVVIGAGPAGLFAALGLIERGLCPIVLERGRDVKSRQKDIGNMFRQRKINPQSNYCYGEGGAGTFSDGKLYTRSSKRGNVKKILRCFVQHGAKEDILIDAHPHLGTNHLPHIISRMRHSILQAGGAIHFDKQIIDFEIENNHIQTAIDQEGNCYKGEAFVLTTGHSARDIYHLLHRKGIALEAKDFAMGVRIEHPQKLINQIQYHCTEKDPLLPTASYQLVTQAQGRGVFSFCMCPGGIIVPAATAPKETVVNGMSNAKRSSPFANSGIVVSINTAELNTYQQKGIFAGLAFQQALEQNAYAQVGEGLKAPAQRMIDFVAKRPSANLPKRSSYYLGTQNSNLHEWLPKPINGTLRQAFKDFGRKMKGFYTEEAVIIGVESRTSSPIRIPRRKDSMQHPQISNLYPCGEGAGYAGGIVSSAMDGENAAMRIAARFK